MSQSVTIGRNINIMSLTYNLNTVIMAILCNFTFIELKFQLRIVFDTYITWLENKCVPKMYHFFYVTL